MKPLWKLILKKISSALSIIDMLEKKNQEEEVRTHLGCGFIG